MRNDFPVAFYIDTHNWMTVLNMKGTLWHTVKYAYSDIV